MNVHMNVHYNNTRCARKDTYLPAGRYSNSQVLRHTILPDKGGQVLFWCPRRDSNSQVLRHTILSRACLPISPPGLLIIEIIIKKRYTVTNYGKDYFISQSEGRSR